MKLVVIVDKECVRVLVSLIPKSVFYTQLVMLNPHCLTQTVFYGQSAVGAGVGGRHWAVASRQSAIRSPPTLN